jgi:hypothetical protein
MGCLSEKGGLLLTMFCQLARACETGELLWVCVEKPFDRHVNGTLYSGSFERNDTTIHGFHTNYISSLCVGYLVVDARDIELLPYFDEREPRRYEEWVMYGEQLPHNCTHVA